jgi:hypothetical protein
MTDFLKDCYFNGFCKGRKKFVPTPRYAKKLRAMQESGESIFVVEFSEDLREFESICKTVLAHESGDPGVQSNEKNRGSKISWHCPFRHTRIVNKLSLIYRVFNNNVLKLLFVNNYKR